jgi:RNA polymerase sigma-70 factor, ECF subfamily
VNRSSVLGQSTGTERAEAPLSAALRADDASRFTALTERLRRELHLHCYRLLGSLDDAEDAVQDTLLRAWRNRHTFQGRSPVRSWLYRIATNACLDMLRRHRRRVLPSHVVPANVADEQLAGVPEPLWLQPYPDRLLDELAVSENGPEAAVIAKETIELTFVAAIQLLPPRQRAVLVVRDVLGWSAADTAELLETSVTAVNSTLQRARTALQRNRPSGRLEWARASDSSDQERIMLQRFMHACERADAAAVVELLGEDARCTMPPFLSWFDGREAVAASIVQGLGEGNPGDWRMVATAANRQPAAAAYLRRWGDADFRAFAVHVLRIENGAIVDITGFHEPGLFPAFGLPPTA